MADAITPRTRVIFVCNPNNPTGTVIRGGEFAEFLGRVPADCLVVLDEAYADYVRDPAVPNGIDLYRDHPNLAVLRTFSKAHGLAGLRVGFLIGPEPVASAVRTTMLPFSVNSLAQTAATASLAAEAELHERVDLAVKERARSQTKLASVGGTVQPWASSSSRTRAGRCRRPRPTSSGSGWATTPRTSAPRAPGPGSASGRSGTRARASPWAHRKPTTPSSPWPGPTPGGTRACPIDHSACCASAGRAPRCVVVVAHRNHYGLLLRLAMHPAGGRSQRHRSTGHALGNSGPECSTFSYCRQHLRRVSRPWW